MTILSLLPNSAYRSTVPRRGGTHAVIPDSRPEIIRRSVEGSAPPAAHRPHRPLLSAPHRPESRTGRGGRCNGRSDPRGKILHWGISEATEEYLRRAHKVCPVTAVQNRYSMMARWHENLFPVLEELGIGFVAFSPLANGLLTDCYTADTTFDPATDYRASMPQFRGRVSGRTVHSSPLSETWRKSIMQPRRRSHWPG